MVDRKENHKFDLGVKRLTHSDLYTNKATTVIIREFCPDYHCLTENLKEINKFDSLTLL